MQIDVRRTDELSVEDRDALRGLSTVVYPSEEAESWPASDRVGLAAVVHVLPGRRRPDPLARRGTACVDRPANRGVSSGLPRPSRSIPMTRPRRKPVSEPPGAGNRSSLTTLEHLPNVGPTP